MAREARGDKGQKHRARRRVVLDAAAAVFAEVGYHEATIEEIAHRAGMRPAGLYYYFDSKEAALAEVCRQGAEWFIEGFRTIASDGKPIELLIRQGVAHHIQREYHAYIENFAHNRRNLPLAAQRRLAWFARQYRDLWINLLARGSRDGTLRRDLDGDTAAIAIIGACNEATSWISRMSVPQVEQVRKRMAAVLLDGMRA